jgi:histidinol phosphatase-like PHP family hydrolase
MIDENSTKEEVMEAVKQNGSALQYASEELRNDREVVLEAVKTDNYAFEDASDALKADREVVLEVVRKHGHALQWASNELKNDPEVVLEAVKQDRIRFSRYGDYSEEAQLNLVSNYVDKFSNKLKFELLECWVINKTLI